MVVVDPKTVARTERLLLRALVIGDAEDVLFMRRHPEVMKHTSIRASDDIETTKAWIQGCFDSEINWNFAIEVLPSSQTTPAISTSQPRVIGLIGAVRAPEIGYMFNASYWGHGYATEALRAFMPLFFEHFSGHESTSEEDTGQRPARFEYAEAHTDTELVASQNVLTKAGFTLHETRVKDFENPLLGWRDTLVYRMYRPDAEKERVSETV